MYALYICRVRWNCNVTENDVTKLKLRSRMYALVAETFANAEMMVRNDVLEGNYGDGTLDGDVWVSSIKRRNLNIVGNDCLLDAIDMPRTENGVTFYPRMSEGETNLYEVKVEVIRHDDKKEVRSCFSYDDLRFAYQNVKSNIEAAEIDVDMAGEGEESDIQTIPMYKSVRRVGVRKVF